MEILRIEVRLTGCNEVAGGTERVVMLPFTGCCKGMLFTGEILPGGVDTQRIDGAGRCRLSARYALKGVDSQGNDCQLFIENVAVSAPGEEMLTHPSIRTDSPALRWLETAQLTGRIEHHEDHLEIVIFSEDVPGVEHITLQRAGLKLQGRLEKKHAGKVPLVLMLHGFGGDMGVHPDSWYQSLSDRLTAAGMATLRMDFNGHGQSEGCFSAMTPYNEVEDAAVFLQYAMHREDVSEIYVLGHSQGGVVGGMLVGYYHDVVKKLVLLAPAASLKYDAIHGQCMAAKYDAQKIPEAVTVDGVHSVGGLFFRMAQTLPIYEVTRCFAGPALVVLAGKDQVVRADWVARYADELPCGTLLQLPTLDHGLGGPEHEAAMQKVVDFLKEA